MGIYHFTRLPFGPERAPSYFQEMMAKIVLLGLIYHICEVYFDDIIVYGKGFEEFCERLRAVRVQAYVRFGSRTIRSTRFIA